MSATMKPPAPGFGANLRRLRLAAGLSQQTLADATGLTNAAISRFERGRMEPLLLTVRLLAEALGCRPEKLVNPLD